MKKSLAIITIVLARPKWILPASYSILGILLIVLPVLLRDRPYLMYVATITCIFAVLALSFNLVWGYTGIVSLSHTAFFGIGAYCAGLLATRTGMPFWIDFPASGLVAGLIAFLVGIPALRFSKTSLVMVTLAFLVVVQVAVNNGGSYTGGPNGIPNIPHVTIPFLSVQNVWIAAKAVDYYLCLLYALVVVYFSNRLVRSRIGRVMIAIREDEFLAQSFGVNCFKYKLLIFVVGAVIAGSAGSLYAHYITFVGPSIFSMDYATRLLIMVMVGGLGTIGGVIAGSVLFTFIPEFLRVAQELRELMFGVTFTLFLLFMPRGIAGLLKDIQVSLSKRVGDAL
jgi:branched-chain amino acid transport system permease protein